MDSIYSVVDTHRRVLLAERVSATVTQAEAGTLAVILGDTRAAANIITEARRVCGRLTDRDSRRFTDRLSSPETIPVFHGREGASLHTVDVKSALQMIDLMLQNPRIPSRCIY